MSFGFPIWVVCYVGLGATNAVAVGETIESWVDWR